MKFSFFLVLISSLAFVAACGGDDEGSGALDQGVSNSPEDLGGFNPQNNTSDAGNLADTGALADMGSPTLDMAPDLNPNVDASTDMAPFDVGGLDMASPDMPGMCDENGFSTTSSFAEAPTEADSFFYVAFQGEEENPPFDQFNLEIYNEFGGVVTTQTFDFTGESYADCGVCLLIFRCRTAEDCDTFMPQKGSVEITSIGTADGDTFAAQFTDLELAEVDVNFDTFETSVISGGDSWCIETLSANANVTTF